MRNAFRLMLSPATVAAAQNAIDLIWIDDIAVPSFRNGAEVGALIFDEAVLRNGAEISVSDFTANRFQSLSDRLNYQARSANRSELAMTEEGNVVVGIKNVARVMAVDGSRWCRCSCERSGCFRHAKKHCNYKWAKVCSWMNCPEITPEKSDANCNAGNVCIKRRRFYSGVVWQA